MELQRNPRTSRIAENPSYDLEIQVLELAKFGRDAVAAGVVDTVGPILG